MASLTFRSAFALALVVCLATSPGCSKKTPAGGGGASGGSGDRPKVAFITNNAFDFWTIARRGTEKAAAEFKVDVEFRAPPQGTSAEQRQYIEDMLVKGVKGIAISPNSAADQVDYLNEVAQKVPLITQDSDLPAGSKRLCYVGTNNFEAGRAAGELVKKAVAAGTVVIFVGGLDKQNAIERRNGVVAALAGVTTFQEANKIVNGGYPLNCGRHIVLGTMTDEGKREKCKANADDTLVKHPDVACLVGLYEYNPPALLLAVKDAKKEGKVAIVGFDENEQTLQGIKDGHVYGTVVQQPFEFGYQSIRILAALARDPNAKNDPNVIPKDGIQYVPHKEITKENVEAFHAELKRLTAK